MLMLLVVMDYRVLGSNCRKEKSKGRRILDLIIHTLWVELHSPPNRYVEVLTPSTSECDLILKQRKFWLIIIYIIS